jgi:uncharacterized protein YkwD
MTLAVGRRIAGLGLSAVVLTAGSLWIGHQAEAPTADEAIEAGAPIASFNDLVAWLRRPTTTTAQPTATTRPEVTTTTMAPPTTTTAAPVTTVAPSATTAPVTPPTRPVPPTEAPATTVAPPPTTTAPAPPPPSGGAPAATQADLLAQVNARRATGLNCGGVWFPPVPPLTLQGTLGAAAQGHADDLATRNYFSHTGLDGSSPADRITAAGYRWRAWAENIAAGQVTTTAAITGWFNSPGHCENFMSSTVTQVGFGLAQNPSSTYRIYWVADMARPF